MPLSTSPKPTFLKLTEEKTEPFIIPNVSPVSSPTMQATEVGSPTITELLNGKERKMSVIALN